MPCRDWEGVDSSYSSSDYDAVSNRLDKTTRILCEVLTHCCGKGIIDPAVFSKETQEWWKKHQEDDRIHREREEENKKRREREKKKEEEKKQVIKSLTPEQRKALGL